MSVGIPNVVVGINQIGLTLRPRNDIRPLEKKHVDKATIQYFIHLDEQNEYTFLLEHSWYEEAFHHEFYDGTTKIMEAYFNQGTQQLIINIHTQRQTNLFSDFKAAKCLIKSEGPLFIDGAFKIKSSLGILAQSLCLLDTVDWGMAAANVVDSFYTPEQVDDYLNNGAHYTAEARKQYDQGNILQGYAELQTAETYTNAAMFMEGVHAVANATKPLVDFVMGTDKRVASPPKVSQMGIFGKNESIQDSRKRLDLATASQGLSG